MFKSGSRNRLVKCWFITKSFSGYEIDPTKSHFLCFISWELINLIHSWFHLKVDPIWIRLIGKGTCPFSIQRFNSLNFISTWLAEHSIESISTASAMSLLSVLQGFHTMLTEMIRLLLQRPGKSNFKLTFFAFFLYLGYQTTHIQKKIWFPNLMVYLDAGYVRLT